MHDENKKIKDAIPIDCKLNFGIDTLRRIGKMVPVCLPKGTVLGNRLLKPVFHKLYGSQWIKVEVWPGISMRVDPTECIGGNLFFSPQLYDREEREWVANLLPRNGTFVDIGANIGAYTLWAASQLGPTGTVLAVEADPETFRILSFNLAENVFECDVKLENIGVSNQTERLTFFRNTKRNSGGNSFYRTEDSIPEVELQAVTLMAVFIRNNLKSVDFMKMDIEGFELTVLKKFFEDVNPDFRHLLPRNLLIEIDEGPRRSDKQYKTELLTLIHSEGYKIAKKGKNTLFLLNREG